MSVLSAVFWGLLVLSVLVFVHEGGHYLAARACGMRVTEFFLGMPCRLKLSHRSRTVGTEVGVTPILLGGYTRICGMEGAQDELLAPALALVMEGGRVRVADVAEELGVDEDRACMLLATLSDWASVEPFFDPELGERPNQRTYPQQFQTVARDANLLTEYDRGHDLSLPGSTAAGEPHPLQVAPEEFLEAERSHTYLGGGFLKRFATLFAGPLVNVLLALGIVVACLMARGVAVPSDQNVLGGVREGSVAEAAGLLAGDRVTDVAGTPVSDWSGLSAALGQRLADGSDFDVTVERDGSPLTLRVDLPEGQAPDAVGVLSAVETYHPTLPQAAGAAVDYAGQVATFAFRLVMPQHTMEVLDQSTSIAGISAMAAQAASAGLFELVMFAGAISMSLGFMNLLPVPPLDGGKILVEVVQLVIRRPLSQRVQDFLGYLGLAFILFVFVMALKNDVLHFVIG